VGASYPAHEFSVNKTLGLGIGVLTVLAAACGPPGGQSAIRAGVESAATTTVVSSTPATPEPSSTATTTTTLPTTTAAEGPATAVTAPCSLSGGSDTPQVPIYQVCSASGAPHFVTPQAAMVYLASAWNTHNVEEVDYVTNSAGRQEMDSMASLMVNLQFKNCTLNPAGDYTCYFSHDIIRPTSPTTYPNPNNYPPGEAVFTVAPAQIPGWYLTNVLRCG
jgi:hypothetical protein